jgi:antitoxin StbD
MNAPIKLPLIREIHGQPTTSISALKSNPAMIVAAAAESPVAVLNRNNAVAYLVSPEFVEMAYEALEELLDMELLEERMKEKDQAVQVSLDDLLSD